MIIAAATEFVSKFGDPPYGGVDSRLLNLLNEVGKSHHEVHIFASRQPGHEETESQGNITIHRVGPVRSQVQRGDFRSRLDFGNECKNMIQKLDPDVIECSGFVSYSAGYNAKKTIKKPVMVTVHEVWQGEWMQNMGAINGMAGSILERYYLRKPFDRYITVSEFTKKRLMDRLGIKEEKITVIGNGVNKELYDSVTVSEKFESPTIITACRLVPYKKVDLIIQAVSQLKPKYPDIKLLIVGQGPEEQNLRQLAMDLGVSKNVTFVGKIADQKELIRLFKKSHVFVLSSIVEGFGMVVIEAMAAGIPYVVSDIPPLREVTDGGVGGRLFKPLDVTQLRERIDEALENGLVPDARVSSVLSSYDWKNLANTYVEEATYMSDSRAQISVEKIARPFNRRVI